MTVHSKNKCVKNCFQYSALNAKRSCSRPVACYTRSVVRATHERVEETERVPGPSPSYSRTAFLNGEIRIQRTVSGRRPYLSVSPSGSDRVVSGGPMILHV